jgi:uncharacterized protein YxjI
VAETDAPAKRRRRPAFAVIVVAALGLRVGREVFEEVAFGIGGAAGVFVGFALVVAAITAWRLVVRARARRRGVELTPEIVRAHVAQSGFTAGFEEDGTLLGASILVVSQVPKVLEVVTEHEVYGGDGSRVGTIRQVHQSTWKRFFRLVTPYDQFFTHRFDVLDTEGRRVLHVLRPRKWFYTRVHVFDGEGNQLGTIRQENVFFKIRFNMQTPEGHIVGHLRAQNWRAWDFAIVDHLEREVATVFKSWEGWTRAALTRADSYVVRVARPLDEPLRSLTIAASLTVDLALKQDARSS